MITMIIRCMAYLHTCDSSPFLTTQRQNCSSVAVTQSLFAVPAPLATHVHLYGNLAPIISNLCTKILIILIVYMSGVTGPRLAVDSPRNLMYLIHGSLLIKLIMVMFIATEARDF